MIISRRQFGSLALCALLAILASPAWADAQAPPQESPCVNINTAGFEELQRIIHIGPERARQIIQLRQDRPFASVDQLVRVNGIAAARLRDIREQGLACVPTEGGSALVFAGARYVRMSLGAAS